jgi:gluconokinase
MVIVVMGVSGSGKTTVGRKLAAELGWKFADADDFHSPANIAKMSAGEPLTDADRAPWLAALRAAIDGFFARGENAVVTCSALKEAYRQALADRRLDVRFVYLRGDRALLLSRLQHRAGHFMKAELLDSQLATLEPPQDALTLDIAETPAELVAQIRQQFGV